MAIERMDQATAQEINQEAWDQADAFVNKDRLKTHQLRNVFSAIEKMRTQYKRIQRIKDADKRSAEMGKLDMDLILLKPKIAYAAGKQRSVRFNFFPFVQGAVDAVGNSRDKDKAYQNFFALMESVVGYHKYFESR